MAGCSSAVKSVCHCTRQGWRANAPVAPGKFIRIRRGQKPLDELDTIIHECLHATDWHKDESWVTEVSADIAAVLWKLGYRKTE